MDQPSRQLRSRRHFMQVSALAGGGLALGLRIGSAWGAAPERPRGPLDTTLNAYVRIDARGHVTLVMPKVEMGQGTYTSLPMLIAEELEVGLDTITVEPAPPNPAVYGVDGDQSTGGSTSIRDCWLPLRKAGATARVLLINAAARTWHVTPASCRAERGVVIHQSSGRRLGYGALAATAASLPLPAEPPLKSAQEFKLIGRTTARRDVPDKTRGATVFGIDVRLPQLCVAMLAQSPVAGGTAAEPLREAAALAVPGVRQIVNEGDMVAVVGDNTWAALKGLRALELHWNEGANANVQQSALIAELEAAAGQPGAVAAHTGDAPGAMLRAVTRLEAVYHQPFLAHATMEPMNCTVHWQQGICEIWVGTQAPDRAVAKLAALGLKPEQIRIHNHLIGGGFGRRLEVDGIVLAARVARHVPGPVKVLWQREEDIQHDMYRPYYVDRLSAGLDAHGMPIAWQHTIAGSAVSALWSGEPLKNGIDDDAVESSANPAYAFPNFEVRFVRQEPRGVPTSWWRGVGPTRSIFVVESFIDELAAAARIDPVQYRHGLLQSPRSRAVLELVADKAGWSQPLSAPRGRGVSVQSAFGSYLALVVEVTVDTSILGPTPVRVDRVVCAFDCGQLINPDNVRAQLEGGVIFGLSAALFNEITFSNGRVQQSNFHDFQALRLAQAPQIEVHLLPSAESPGGVGETGTACVAAALCNAIHAATGQRIRTLPVTRGFHA
jgi:isoquinoline 1-oxidoreductase beta subunit